MMDNLDKSAGWPPALALPLIELGLACVRNDIPEKRPLFTETVRSLRDLEKRKDLHTPPPSVGLRPALRGDS